MNDTYCNNCGKNGHLYHQCKMPIISIGIIAVRVHSGQPEYLMIRRKDTLGFMEFIRGKYSVYNKDYLLNLLIEMTVSEKNRLQTLSFDEIWNELWHKNDLSSQHSTEQNLSRDKFNILKSGLYIQNQFNTLESLIQESNARATWHEAEWGFPKGRRNNHEKDYDCAVREFCEETGYQKQYLKNVENVIPFEEIFMGSNYKSYKHKYYLMYMNFENTRNMNEYDKDEVSQMEWKSYEDCINSIRPYNLEKRRVLTNIRNCLKICKIVEM